MCHDTLTRSRESARQRLRDTGISTRPGGSPTADTSLTNNGTHLSLGSIKLSAYFGNAATMMWATFKRFNAIGHYKEVVEKRFDGGYPRWSLLEKIGDHPVSMAFWAVFYAGFYYKFATAWWQ